MKIKILVVSCLLSLCSSAFSQNNAKSRIYEVWDNQPAPNRGGDYSKSKAHGFPIDQDWEQESYPLGNGYMGINVFGRTDVERIQITEKTLANEGLYGLGGMTNFAEVYLEFNHLTPKNYKRSLNLNNGVFNVSYNYKGVQYTREYFVSYPNNVIAIKLSANKKKQLSFVLDAEIPHKRSIKETNTKTGIATAQDNGIILSGNIAHFNVNYEAQIKVVQKGGELQSYNTNKGSKIKVNAADEVVIYIATGTNYKLDSKVFLESNPHKKLNGAIDPHNKVSSLIQKAVDMNYDALKAAHIKDYQSLFGRVNLELATTVPNLTTRALLENYKKGNANPYLEELMFHFGRYLLISSSRKGTLPCGLQGVWSQYAVTPFTGGFWHNINVQMNYWGAFSANLKETFTPYVEYYQAYLPSAQAFATKYLQKHNPKALSLKENNGWTIGTGASAYTTSAPGGHSGPGTGGFTTKLFWDRFEFTRDTTFLKTAAYPALKGMSTFLSKTLEPAADGTLLVGHSASPEQKHHQEHYITKGTTFDQGFVWETYNDLLKSAKILEKSSPFLDTIKQQIKKLDPILIGASGQIKEFREENFYSDIGSPQHRHISHLCPIYPGTLINSSKPTWVQAVSTVLDLRGNNTTGWAMAHRMNVRARTKEAEKAHAVYAKFLKERTCPNLWTLHPPFQIDGNLGTMAGVVEMLVQSHEGFIELLPALPKAWSTGSFSGLVARGNFEIDVTWKKGKITHCKVVAKNGGVCAFKIPKGTTIVIINGNGKKVPYSIRSKQIIEFKTSPSEKYYIKGV